MEKILEGERINQHVKLFSGRRNWNRLKKLDQISHQGHVENILDECLHAVTALTNNFSQ